MNVIKKPDISRQINDSLRNRREKERILRLKQVRTLEEILKLNGKYVKNTKSCIYSIILERTIPQNFIIGSLMTELNEQILYKKENKITTITLITKSGNKKQYSFQIVKGEIWLNF